MRTSRGQIKARLSQFFNFSEENFAFGVPMSGQTKKDLYRFIYAVTIGLFFAVITGFPGTSPVYSAFLKNELKVNNTLYAIFAALPYVLVILQIPFAAHLRKKPRVKQYFITFSLIARLNFAVLGILSFVLRDSHRVALIAILLGLQALTSVVWWISDLCFSLWAGAACPIRCSGRFFSTRQLSFTLAQLVYSSVLTVLLAVLANHPAQYLILFSLAALFGCLDIINFFFVTDPKIKPADIIKNEELQVLEAEAASRKNPRKRVKTASGPFANKNYRNYLFFGILWYFGIFLMAPFTNVFMLEQLLIPTSRQTLYVSLLPGIATVLFVRKTGMISDRFGYRNSLLFFSSISALSPLLWLLVTPQTEALIGVINLLWGITGVATDLAMFSMGIYLAPAEDRTSYLSAKSVAMNLLGVAPAILLGGVIMDKLRPILATADLAFIGGQRFMPFHFIAIISALLRFIAIFSFARRIKQDNELDFKGFLKKLGQGTRFRFRLRSGLLNSKRK